MSKCLQQFVLFAYTIERPAVDRSGVRVVWVCRGETVVENILVTFAVTVAVTLLYWQIFHVTAFFRFCEIQ